MFFLFLIISYIFCYFLFTYFFQIFFSWKISKTNFCLLHIFIFSLSFIFVIFISNDVIWWEFWNRIQHSIWWGFCLVMILFFSVKASLVKITKLQFFFLSFFITSTFWVFNEMIEFIGQNYLDILFAPNENDIWLDLYANQFWILLWSIFFSIFLENKFKEKIQIKI